MIKDLCLLIFLIILLSFAIYLFLTLPRLSKKREFQRLMSYDYAHRGLHDETIPENSLKAFKRAVEHGYGMELDVQLSQDQELVIMHDFNLKRACGVDFDVDHCTLEECEQFTLFGSNEKIPELKAVLETVAGKTPLIIEIKQKGIDNTVCRKTAMLLDHYEGLFCVESFNPIAVCWFKKHRPNFLRGQLSDSFLHDEKMNRTLKFILKNLLTNFLSRPDFIAYHVEHLDNLAFRLNRLLYQVSTVTWTLRDQETYQKVKKNVDCVIFENFIPK